MTEKLYYSDVHADTFTATVVSSEKTDKGFLTVLDKTAFFPEEGGQGCDNGFINDIKVEHVSIKNDTIFHLLAKELTPGTLVTGRIDYAQRFDYMQQHSGEHILSGLAHSMYGCTNVGFHLGANETTLDFDKALSSEELTVLEAKANEAVLKNLPVSCSFPTPEVLATLDYRSKLALTENVRIVEIPGIDLCACCAPHVDSTGQICLIKIIKKEAWKGGVRLTILCGKRALDYFSSTLSLLDSLTRLTSASPAQLYEAVSKLKEDLAQSKAGYNTLEGELLSLKLAAATPLEASSPLLLFTASADSRTVRNTVNSVVNKRSGLCAVFTGNDTAGYNFILACSKGGCKNLMQELRTRMQAKCGGDDKMLQGSISKTQQEISDFLLTF